MQYLYRNKNNNNKIKIRKLATILIAALTCLCWAFALTQLIGSLASPIKSIPAFLSLQAGMAGDSTANNSTANNGASAFQRYQQQDVGLKTTTNQDETETEPIIPAFRPYNQMPTASQVSTNTVFSSPEEVLSYLQSYDKDIRLISSHQENNYLDLYFYSPLLEKNSGNSSPFNMQVAVTKNHTYFGTPFINYDF